MEPRNKRFLRRKSKANRNDKNTSRSRTTSRKATYQDRFNEAHQGGQRTPKLILDSSILVKLVMDEPDSKEARKTVADGLKKGYTLHTVDIALAEVLNVVWKHANILKDLKMEEAKPAAEDLTKIYDGLKIITTRELEDETMQIALTQNMTVYDSLYIAATQKLNGTLYTADQKLYTTADRVANSKLLKSKP
jgi:predicted nucleic acid-binding protein